MKEILLEILEDPLRGFDSLTGKEREVARLASRGMLTTEIAKEMSHLNTNAVAAVLRSIYYKTGMNKNGLIKNLIKQIDRAIK